ncbi:MAG: ABC transporter ATP-binding protein, partial [Mariniblastus sp.]|nr:ABC transporter ATP-binding protein [Mariniblastus sp.]
TTSKNRFTQLQIMTASEVVVETKNLTKRYGEFTALDDLSIAICRGQILGFIGPNGAGKTTTIKILVGLSRPTSGSATIAGADCVKDSRRIRKLVGYMPDKFGSYDNMRVVEYLDFFGAAFGISRRERRKRIDEVLETTQSTYMRDRYVESLSHGMQQRVGIARTLLHDPEVLIFDEPANGLDPEARIEMRQILLNLAEMGKTLIVTSHILPELSRICDQVAIIHGGKLRAAGSLEDITRQVNQRRMVEVQLTISGQLESAAGLIKNLIEADAEVTTSATESIVRFMTGEGEKKLEQILSVLIKNDIGISQFSEIAGDLEDAFLMVTRESSGRPGEERPKPSSGEEQSMPEASKKGNSC